MRYLIDAVSVYSYVNVVNLLLFFYMYIYVIKAIIFSNRLYFYQIRRSISFDNPEK